MRDHCWIIIMGCCSCCQAVDPAVRNMMAKFMNIPSSWQRFECHTVSALWEHMVTSAKKQNSKYLLFRSTTFYLNDKIFLLKKPALNHIGKGRVKQSNILCFLTLVIWPCNFKGGPLIFFNSLSFQMLFYASFVFCCSHFLGGDFLPLLLYWSFLECVLSFQLVCMWYLTQRATESDPKHIIYVPCLSHFTSAHVIFLAKCIGSFCAVRDQFENQSRG